MTEGPRWYNEQTRWYNEQIRCLSSHKAYVSLLH